MAAAETSAGYSLTAVSVVLLGPVFGPYALIVISALAGAMWPLLASVTEAKGEGGWLLLRCTLTAVFLTGFLAEVMARTWSFSALEMLGPVAFAIGAMGNGWRPVFNSLGGLVTSIAGGLGGNK